MYGCDYFSHHFPAINLALLKDAVEPKSFGGLALNVFGGFGALPILRIPFSASDFPAQNPFLNSVRKVPDSQISGIFGLDADPRPM